MWRNVWMKEWTWLKMESCPTLRTYQPLNSLRPQDGAPSHNKSRKKSQLDAEVIWNFPSPKDFARRSDVLSVRSWERIGVIKADELSRIILRPSKSSVTAFMCMGTDSSMRRHKGCGPIVVMKISTERPKVLTLLPWSNWLQPTLEAWILNDGQWRKVRALRMVFVKDWDREAPPMICV